MKKDGDGMKDKDAVNHPAHYQGKYECIDEMMKKSYTRDIKGLLWRFY